MEIRIEAVQVAESFNMKKFGAEFGAEIYSGSTSEVLLYHGRYGALLRRF